MHEVVERLKRDGIPVEDDGRRRIGPARAEPGNSVGIVTCVSNRGPGRRHSKADEKDLLAIARGEID